MSLSRYAWPRLPPRSRAHLVTVREERCGAGALACVKDVKIRRDARQQDYNMQRNPRIRRQSRRERVCAAGEILEWPAHFNARLSVNRYGPSFHVDAL